MAIALSFLVLLAYSALVPKPKPVVVQDVMNEEAVGQPLVTPAIPPDQKTQIIPKSLNENDLYRFESGDLILLFSRRGAYIHSIHDKTFDVNLDLKDIGLVPQWQEYDFALTALPKGLEFSYKEADGTIIKKIFRSKDDGTMDLDIIISNVTYSSEISYDIICSMIGANKSDAANERYYEAFFQSRNVVSRKAVFGLKTPKEIQDRVEWAGMRDRYFCSVFVPQFLIEKGVIGVSGKTPYISLHVANEAPKSQERIENSFKLFVGLQDERILVNLGKGAERVVNFGFFDLIAKAILSLLTVIHRLLHNWGWSIIAITTVIYFLLFPLSFRSMTSMRKMQALQPKIEALRAKYKDNPQKLQIATMELYKEEKVNPLGGCFPMLLQIPVFFSLYQLLMRFPQLRGAHFLWIKDLSSPDRLVILPKTIPFIGNEINILPILMAFIMFLQQKLSMGAKTMTGTAADQQKIMMFMMPVIFGFLFYRMSSGLVLYWLVNSLLMLVFQWKISRQK
ncbi:MAG: membrane protein insertase YidC [Candidatus Omnitrophota bacterium]